MNLRYKGGFYSVNKALYDVEIFQEGYAGTVTTVAFTDSPLEIEWKETDKLEPVQSSSAKLSLFSDTDRQFVDLYTVKVGQIRMDVYRNEALYWSGMLDPELYEEPFAYKNGYGVDITFSDLACLDRLKWDITGFVTLGEVIGYALRQSGISHTGVVEHISTKTYASSTDRLTSTISLQAENFYDEDGEARTIREVLEEALRPFALRLIQKSGKIIVYDLHDLHTTFSPEAIGWETDNAVLGVDKVYNNVKVAFSPFEKTVLLKGVVDAKSVGTGQEINVWVNTGAEADEKGFTITLSNEGKGLTKHNSARFFRIDPVHSGSEETGIAWTVQSYNPAGTHTYQNYLNTPSAATNAMLLKVPSQAYIAHINLSDRAKYKLKLNLSLLADVRYNPFEEKSKTNEAGNWDRLKNWCNYTYVPFMLTLRDQEGRALYHWSNKSVMQSRSYVNTSAKWISGEGAWGDAWFCWYSGDRKSESGLGGWQSNKRIIGYCRDKDLPVLFEKTDNAEYIDLPPVAGWLELQVGTGIQSYDYESSTSWKLRDDIYPLMHWLLYKEPTIALVNQHYRPVKSEDIEHSAWINREAMEDITIDTIVGTLSTPSPTALGQFFNTADKTVRSTFCRNGVDDLLERLLISTVYSNYAERHHTLSGTVSLLPSFGTYTDSNLPGHYLLLSETQRLREDESDILMVQFEKDNYEGVKFDE